MSRPVSCDPPLSAATMVSVAGCDAPQASADRAVSTPVAPASIAVKYVIGAKPVVECVWMLTGRLQPLTSAATRERALAGARIPATSSTPIQSAPICLRRLADRTNQASSCAGLGL